MSDPQDSVDTGIEIRTYFVRGRNALVARADFSELYASLYLHQMDAGIRHEGPLDQLLRDALAAIALHCASKPRNEAVAWTVSFQSPKANVFVSGDSQLGTVVGSLHTDNVKEAEKNLFFSDMIVPGQPPRRSVVEFTEDNFFRATEAFYRQSEQRPVRFFQVDEEDFVLVAAQPDCDLEWLEGLDDSAVKLLDKNAELSLLEQRRYRFECGCNQERMLAMLAPVMRQDADNLFGDEETIRVTCPRCGMRHVITRESLEAWLAADQAK